METWTVEARVAGERADVFLASAMQVTRGTAQRLLENGAACVNGAAAKANRKLKAGDTVTAEMPAPTATEVRAEAIPLDVVYEDGDLLVINKARGMVVHPAPGAEHGTLVNAVLAHAEDLSGIGGELRPGIVHRLDKDTSGLIVVAKTDAAHVALQAQIQAKTAARTYTALVWGTPKLTAMRVDAPLGRSRTDRKKMAVNGDAARDAVTELSVRESFGVFSRLEARLQTGRTHQIRVHCAYLGHPVAGDPVYGGIRKVPAVGISTTARQSVEAALDRLNGQALHAAVLAFDHPRTGERLTFSAPLPMVLEEFLTTLRTVYGALPEGETL